MWTQMFGVVERGDLQRYSQLVEVLGRFDAYFPISGELEKWGSNPADLGFDLGQQAPRPRLPRGRGG